MQVYDSWKEEGSSPLRAKCSPLIPLLSTQCNSPTAAMAGALSKMYLVHTSLMVLASIAWAKRGKYSSVYIAMQVLEQF